MPPKGGRRFSSGVHRDLWTSESIAKRLSSTYVDGTVRLLIGQRGVGSRAQTCEA